MHKFYVPKLFDIVTDAGQLRVLYAPMASTSDGTALRPEEASELTREQALQQAVDVDALDRFIAAGFDVTFVGPDESLLPDTAGAACGGGDAVGEAGADSPLVEEAIFLPVDRLGGDAGVHGAGALVG